MKCWVKKVVIFGLLLILFVGNVIPSYGMSELFLDINTHWSKEYIQWGIDNNYIEGYPDNTFRPENEMTRAEYYTMVNRLGKYTEKVVTEFDDVAKESWFYETVSIAVAAGYIKENEKNIYAEEKITREEAAKILANVYRLESNPQNIALFKDYDEIKSKGIVGGLVEKGIIDGYPDNTFQPNRFLKRSEVVKLFYNCVEKMGLPKQQETTIVSVTNNHDNKNSMSGGESPFWSVVVDKSELKKKITELANTNVNSMTEGSRAVFKKALKIAKRVLEDKNATQKEIDSALEKLLIAYKQLEENTVVPQAFKVYFIIQDELGNVIKNPNILIKDNGGTIVEIKNTLKPGIYYYEVNQKGYQVATGTFCIRDKEETIMVYLQREVSRETLKEAILQGEEVDTRGKTENSIEVLKRALEMGKEILNKAGATQEEIDNCTRSILTAILELEEEKLKVDKSALEEKYLELQDKVQGDYTEESWRAFVEVLEKARLALEREEVAQEEIDTILENLNQKVLELVQNVKVYEVIFETEPKDTHISVVKADDLREVSKDGNRNYFLETGNYIATISKEGYQTTKQEFLVNDGEPTIVSVTLEEILFKYIVNEENTEVTITGYQVREVPVDLVIPEEINGVPVRHIGESAFSYDRLGSYNYMKAQLCSISLPEGLWTIGEKSFEGNLLGEVEIPSSVVELKDKCFNKNLELGKVTFGENSKLRKIGNGAFYNSSEPKTSIIELLFPENLEVIGERAFRNNAIKELVLPETLKEMGAGAFARNQIERVVIPSQIERAGYSQNGTEGYGVFMGMTNKKGKEVYTQVFDLSGKVRPMDVWGVVNPITVNVVCKDELGNEIVKESVRKAVGMEIKRVVSDTKIEEGDYHYFFNYEAPKYRNLSLYEKESVKIDLNNYFIKGKEYTFLPVTIEGYLTPEPIVKTLEQDIEEIEFIYDKIK